MVGAVLRTLKHYRPDMELVLPCPEQFVDFVARWHFLDLGEFRRGRNRYLITTFEDKSGYSAYHLQ
jgi:hypothetical protein